MTTGELLKWKVIVPLPLLKTNEFAAVPFTVKSLALTVAGFTGSLRLTMKSVGCVLMMLLQAGVGGGHGKTHQLSIGEGILLGCAVDGDAPVRP